MPSIKVVVNFADKPGYDVRIGAGVADAIGQRIAQTIPGARQVIVVSDENVAALYGDAVRASVKAAGLWCRSLVIPAGEASKSIACLTEILRTMARLQVDRTCTVVALGGGVVGDVAGLVAALYQRGVNLVQMPTSLLAMVDSSVGGKTAVDIPEGKNLVGAFKQPAYVCADTRCLASLPDREWVCGWGEVVKSAVLSADDFFGWMYANIVGLAARDEELVCEAIARCVVFKAGVVAADEEDLADRRACLNLGHTLGHAIETRTGWGTFSHGACVAEGMRFATRLSAALGYASQDFVVRVDGLLDALAGAPLEYAATVDELIDAMRIDKKNRGGHIRFVLPHGVGSYSVEEVDEGVLRAQLEAWLAEKSGGER